MALHTYDLKRHVIIIGGVVMSGFADGTALTVERSAETFTKKVGADGIVTRSKTNDRSGTAKLSLVATSQSNDVLSGFALADETMNTGIVPFLVQDLEGLTKYVSAFAWIKKPPSSEFGKEVSNREWEFDLSDLEFFIGGSLPIGL
jgi:hypothetical protein